MSETTYTLTATCTLKIIVRNPDAIERVTGPRGDEWRSQFYGLTTVADVLEHWTYNALINGVYEVNRLDGWADLAPDAVRIDREYADADFAAAVA